ncbi:MAG: FAD-binding protein [Candidatus Electrothrix sp. MAN1_4]|nr:FAD-binding protein [Candidatus Electrothrix sp. MAN1_4]
MEKKIIQKIQRAVGQANLLTDVEDRSCYSYDASSQNFMPDAVALPETKEQVAALLALADEYGFPVIPRGAGSGTTGGALPVQGGLVIGFSRMKRILEIDPDNMIAVVEPGVVTGELQAALRKYGLMYPPDPASLKFCTIGGNAGECAGGPSAVKYGVTRDYIIGLEVVLPGGKIMRTGVRTEKGVVGYDLTRLFIGSEGTLAVFTKLILRLLPLAEAKGTFLLSFTSLAKATSLVAEILAAGLMPCTLEYMDKTAVQVVRDQITWQPPEKTAALLLVEFDGSTTEVERQGQGFTDFVRQKKNCTLRQAADETEIEELWQARRSIAPACLHLRPHKIAEDVVVPRSRIPELVQFTEQLAHELNLIILTFGHAGDGNIHVNIMVDKQNQEEYNNGCKAKERLFEHVLALGGTLSGEHGVGITKSPFLAQELDATALSVMQQLKTLFDPHNILNPGKIFPV